MSAVKPPMSFPEKVRAMMQRSGLDYHQCLRRMASAGGRTAARNKRRRRQLAEGERARCERMKLD